MFILRLQFSTGGLSTGGLAPGTSVRTFVYTLLTVPDPAALFGKDGLIPHFYVDEWTQEMAENSVSMPSLAYTSFLRYPFKNLGFMRFPEPVFAGIYQNILTTAVFRAC